MSLDGCQVTKLQNYSITPVILLNLNLPPEERYRNKNILLLLLIPGPRTYQDLNSFVQLLVQELLLLGKGKTGVYNKFTDSIFTLRAWYFLLSADGPASVSALGTKTPGNAKRPCPYCQIQGDNNRTGNYYYIPHTDAEIEQLDLRGDIRNDIKEQSRIQAVGLSDYIGTALGFTKRSILLNLPTFVFPDSFPLDPIHCFLQNLIPEIYRRFGGTKLLARE